MARLTTAELSAVRLVAQAAERVILNGGVRQNETGQYDRTNQQHVCMRLTAVGFRGELMEWVTPNWSTMYCLFRLLNVEAHKSKWHMRSTYEI